MQGTSDVTPLMGPGRRGPRKLTLQSDRSVSPTSGPTTVGVLVGLLVLLGLAVVGLAIGLGITAARTPVEEETFEYVVVGGGSAGMVLAHLLKKAGHNVVLLEAGPDNDNDPNIVEAKFIGALESGFRNNYFWLENNPPNSNLPNDDGHYSGGRLLGGSSNVNDNIHWKWKLSRISEWGGLFANTEYIKTVMRNSEKFTGVTQSPTLRGTSGPFNISQSDDFGISNKFVNVFHDIMLNDYGANVPVVDDWNSVDGPAASSRGQYWIDPTNYGRQSSSRVLDKGPFSVHVDIRVNATVDRVVFDANKVARTVEYAQNGVFKRAHATKKVIITAGQRSFAILERSGVGDATRLQNLDIPLVYHNPNVGENLKNHMLLTVPSTAPAADTVGLDVVKNKAACGFIAFPAIDNVDKTARDMELVLIVPSPTVFVYGIVLNNPASIGHAHILGRDPAHPILPVFNYFSEAIDKQRFVDGLELVNKIATEMHNLDPDYNLLVNITADPESYVVSNTVHIHHPQSTCGIGKVVTSDLHVMGVSNLMVADASVFPDNAIVNGHTYASALYTGMVAYTILTGDMDPTF